MKQTLVIARDWRVARLEAEYQAAKIAQPPFWRHRHGEFRLDDSVAIFYSDPQTAAMQMLGLRLSEIVIPDNYLEWKMPYPGAFTELAYRIDVAVARGAQRRWER